MCKHEKSFSGASSELLLQALKDSWRFGASNRPDECGFLILARRGVIDFEKGRHLVSALKQHPSFRDMPGDSVSKEIVRLIWIIPQFLYGKKEFLIEDRDYERAKINALFGDISSEVERILGTA